MSCPATRTQRLCARSIANGNHRNRVSGIPAVFCCPRCGFGCPVSAARQGGHRLVSSTSIYQLPLQNNPGINKNDVVITKHAAEHQPLSRAHRVYDYRFRFWLAGCDCATPLFSLNPYCDFIPLHPLLWTGLDREWFQQQLFRSLSTKTPKLTIDTNTLLRELLRATGILLHQFSEQTGSAVVRVTC